MSKRLIEILDQKVPVDAFPAYILEMVKNRVEMYCGRCKPSVVPSHRDDESQINKLLSEDEDTYEEVYKDLLEIAHAIYEQRNGREFIQWLDPIGIQRSNVKRYRSGVWLAAAIEWHLYEFLLDKINSHRSGACACCGN